jgi:hypothetical protein
MSKPIRPSRVVSQVLQLRQRPCIHDDRDMLIAAAGI